jgi:chromosome segregation ATPase
MSIAEIIALVAGITALVAAVANGLKSKSDAEQTAKRDELAALTTTINELQERNTVLYTRVSALETALETERCKRRDLEAVVMAKDARIAELEAKVKVLEAQLEELEQTPRTRKGKA